MMQTEEVLSRLLNWLEVHGRLEPLLSRSIELRHLKLLDEQNLHDPRAFCQTSEASVFIDCSEAINMLPCRVQMGILLHEIGHIAAQAFVKDTAEVDADLWVQKNVPEAEFAYTDAEYFLPWDTSTRVTAQNIETVSPKFFGMVMEF